MGRKRVRDTDLELPHRVYRHGNGFRYIPLGAPPVMLGNTLDEAMDAWRKRYCPDPPDDWLERFYHQSKGSARTKRAEWTLTLDDIRALVQEADGRCQVSGVPFSWEFHTRSARRPWVPSLDRIKPGGQYSVGNVRLVCSAVNIALSDWGDAVLWKIARSMNRRRNDPSPPEYFPNEGENGS